jgi:hypothetical protein
MSNLSYIAFFETLVKFARVFIVVAQFPYGSVCLLGLIVRSRARLRQVNLHGSGK